MGKRKQSDRQNATMYMAFLTVALGLVKVVIELISKIIDLLKPP